MTPILSGTSGERLLRNGLLTLLITVFSVWYLYDGFVGYPQENRAELLQLLGLTGSEPPAIDAEVTAKAAQAYLTSLKSAKEPPLPEQHWGPPSLQHERDVYYLGPGGYLRLTVEQGQVTDGSWNKAAHSETDLRWQKYIGIVLSAVALGLIIRFAFIATTRVALAEDGLKLRGRPLIPWESMISLKAVVDHESESVELTYGSDKRSSSVRLNGYTVARLPEIVAEICAQKGFGNPMVPRNNGPSAGPQRND
jgi:hypothetical protein